MIKSYHELAKNIRDNAAKVLEAQKIPSLVQAIGKLHFTGSYALDLMTWNDIDMQIVLKEGVDEKEALGGLLLHLTRDPGFIEAQLIHFNGAYKPKMPRGLYLGVKMDLPAYGGVWKLDFWSLKEHDFDINRALLEKLETKLDAPARELILTLKHEMMAGSGRVPQMGSHLLYQAILLEGMRERQAIFKYFAAHGVDIKP